MKQMGFSDEQLPRKTREESAKPGDQTNNEYYAGEAK